MAHLTRSTAWNPGCYRDPDGWSCSTEPRDEADRSVRHLVERTAIDAEEVVRGWWRAGKRRGPGAGLAVAVAGSWGDVAAERYSMAAGAGGELEAEPVADDVDDAVRFPSQSRMPRQSNVKVGCDGEEGRVGRVCCNA